MICFGGTYQVKTLGWHPSCKCGEEKTVPAVVLDSFGGSGTVGLVAQKYNRRFVCLDLKMGYCRMSKREFTAQM